jgi:hypothetical protein
VPAVPVPAYLGGLTPGQRAICGAVLSHLDGRDPVVVDAVGVGILVKRQRTFAELRPARSRMVLSFILSRGIDHVRVRRRLRLSRHRYAHFVDLYSAGDVDDEVRCWLSEAYESSPAD